MTTTTEIAIVELFDNLSIMVIINKERTGYSFKTPKGWGGHHYYSLCNQLDNAFCEQYPELEFELRTNLINQSNK